MQNFHHKMNLNQKQLQYVASPAAVFQGVDLRVDLGKTT
jgi:hypothetical protein